MGDRRNLLGTSAVLVGLGSALITGTAVATADTGGADTQRDDGASAASDSDSSAPAGRSGRHRHAHGDLPGPGGISREDTPRRPNPRETAPGAVATLTDAVVSQPAADEELRPGSGSRASARGRSTGCD